jgi:hypothetical protein
MAMPRWGPPKFVVDLQESCAIRTCLPEDRCHSEFSHRRVEQFAEDTDNPGSVPDVA